MKTQTLKLKPAIFTISLILFFAFQSYTNAQVVDALINTGLGALKGKKNKKGNAESTTSNTSSSKNNNTTGKTNNTVENQLGSIYFANKPFANGNVERKTSFKSNENIYGRLELKTGTVRSVFNIQGPDEKFPFTFFTYNFGLKSARKMEYTNMVWNVAYIDPSDLDKNYLDFEVLPDGKTAKTIMSPSWGFRDGKASAPMFTIVSPDYLSTNQKFEIVIEISYPAWDAWGNQKAEKDWPTVANSFIWDFNTNDVAALKAKADEANNRVISLFDATGKVNYSIPAEYLKPSNPIGMGLTKDNIMKLYSPRSDIKILKLYATEVDNNWYINKNEFGIPVNRYAGQSYVVFYKFNDGNCYRQKMILYQDYSGGGTYGKTYAVLKEAIKFDCGALK